MSERIKFLLTIAFVIFISSSYTCAQTNFEGKIVFRIKYKESYNQITYLVKKDKFRIEPKDTGGMGIMLYDAKKEVMTIIISPKKMYMEMPFDLSPTKGTKRNKTKTFFKNTGKTEKIKGYICEKFEFNSNGRTGEAWMAKNLGKFLFFGNSKNKSKLSNKWQDAVVAGNYFPLKIILNDNAKDKREVVFEVVEIKQEELSDSLFLPPENYEKIDMQKMMDKVK